MRVIYGCIYVIVQMVIAYTLLKYLYAINFCQILMIAFLIFFFSERHLFHLIKIEYVPVIIDKIVTDIIFAKTDLLMLDECFFKNT